ncbi:MAG: hypothetical protein ACHQTE_00375 [Candidatus Saccharimonadales bacterium]
MKENKQISNTQSSTDTLLDHAVVNTHVVSDFRTSILIVSVVANLIILTSWIAIQVTSQYDAQVVGFLFGR